MTQRVLVDANVLASVTCLDWLFHLRTQNDDMFQLHATPDILAEAVRVSRRRSPRADGRLIERRMRKIRECLDEVVEDFSGDEEFSGTDEDDYHVHAAALASRSDIIVSRNAPEDITTTPDREPYEIMTPDVFFLLIAESDPTTFLLAVQGQLAYWGSRPGHSQLDDALHRAQCPAFAAAVREALHVLART